MQETRSNQTARWEPIPGQDRSQYLIGSIRLSRHNLNVVSRKHRSNDGPFASERRVATSTFVVAFCPIR